MRSWRLNREGLRGRRSLAAGPAARCLVGPDDLGDEVHSISDSDGLLTRAEVEQRTGPGRSSLYRLMRAGEFPEPFRISAKSVRWSSAEVEAWATALPRSSGDGIHRAAKAG